MNWLVVEFHRAVSDFNGLSTIDKFLLIEVVLLSLALWGVQSDVKALKRDKR